MVSKNKEKKIIFKYIIYGALLVTILAFAILTALAKIYPYFTIDLFITKDIQSVHYNWFDVTMVGLSELGNPVLGSITILAFTVMLLMEKQRKDGLMLLLSSVGLTLIGLAFKTFVARPRPDSSLINQIGHFSRPDSFPSGHVLYFIGLYGFLLFLIFVRFINSPARTFLITLVSSLIILIGISRIYLGAHWFSDVLGSYLIGIIWLYFMINLHRRFVK